MRVSRDPWMGVDQSAGRGEAAAESRGVATLSVSSETDALHELISDELKEI